MGQRWVRAEDTNMQGRASYPKIPEPIKKNHPSLEAHGTSQGKLPEANGHMCAGLGQHHQK